MDYFCWPSWIWNWIMINGTEIYCCSWRLNVDHLICPLTPNLVFCELLRIFEKSIFNLITICLLHQSQKAYCWLPEVLSFKETKQNGTQNLELLFNCRGWYITALFDLVYRNEMKRNSIYVLEDKHNVGIIMDLSLNMDRNKPWNLTHV